jgi:transcriptional regulator with XRE-family HTH domain
LIGCAKSHVSQIESATGSPSFKVFLAVCDALHADPALLFAEVPAANLGDMYRRFEKWVATIGAEAMEFLLSLDEGEMKLLCERGVEAIQYNRALQAGRASAPTWPKSAP